MNVAVLGTGRVGQTIGSKLVELGHEVTMGSRSADNEDASTWAEAAGSGAGHGTFADAAAAAAIVFNCTAGGVSLEALAAAGPENLAGKVLVDVANPLDFSQGMPPTLSVCNDDSLGERIQAANPDAKVVKALNTVNAAVMVDPGSLPEPGTIFIAGDDGGAKGEVGALLRAFGWPQDSILDLGEIGAARGMEMYLPLWLRMMGALDTAAFNVRVVR
jgi:8-hydroxy-5-deazaflavin:NADPH oxidoreductase